MNPKGSKCILGQAKNFRGKSKGALCKMKEGLDPLDIGTLLHGILFAYQKTTKDTLGTGAAIFVHPVLNIIKGISKRSGVSLIKGSNIDEVFENLSRVMPTTGLVKSFGLEKLSCNTYILHVDECAWATHIHSELKPRDVTCPYALVAMSIFEEVLGCRVKVADSEYTENGCRTRIEPLLESK